MSTPEHLLSSVGMKKTKIGAGDKDEGYEIKESSLMGLVGSVLVVFAIMGLMVVSMVYDVHLEKKTFHRQLRQEEHHGASKLAQVQLELWSQYHDDVKESHEAAGLMKSLNSSLMLHQAKVKLSVLAFANELNIKQDKADKFADKILHLVADMQQDNVKHAKGLLDHIVKAGKRSEKLEKHVDKQLRKEVKLEKEHTESGEVNKAHEDDEEDEPDPLKHVLEGFFATFDDFEGEFKGQPRATLKDGHPIQEEIIALLAKMQSEDPPTEQEASDELDKIDLASIGVKMGAGRVLPVEDILEEMTMITSIPHDALEALKEDWSKGKLDSVSVMSSLKDMHQKGQIPSGWLQMGIQAEERDEEEMEGRDDGGNEI